VALVYVGPAEHGWAVFKADGEYEVAAKGQSKRITLFKMGDVFVRHGTASERWQQNDVLRLVGQIVARRKEVWGAEIREQLTAASLGLSAQALQQLPASAVTWRVDAEGFDQLITELMRRGDDIPIRQLLNQVARDAAELFGSNEEDLRLLLDRLSSIAALALQYERYDWLERTVRTFLRVYEIGFHEPDGGDRGKAAVWLWLDIISRIFALGGLAVRLEAWRAVRLLAQQRPQGQSAQRYGNWLKHALTMAAREHIFETEEKAGLLARAHNVVRAVTALHPDCPADSEAVLTSLCQFDAYGGLIAIGVVGDTGYKNFYTNFARYYTQRTEPAFVKIVTDTAVRTELFQSDIALLADAIQEMSRMAGKESFAFGGWDGITDQRVLTFVAENRSAD
jgi:hypothetical protein